MTRAFLSVPRYDWCTPLSHPSSCILVNNGPSQQSSQEEYKPWKWGVTAQRPYYQRRSPRQDSAGNRTTRRPPGQRKETQTAVVWSCLPFIRSGQTYLARQQWKWEEDKTDRGRGGKTTSASGQALSSPSPRGQSRTERNGTNWLLNHLWCPATLAIKA